MDKNLNQILKNKYTAIISNFEEYLKNLKNNTSHKGYLIDLKQLNDIKKKIDYKNNVKSLSKIYKNNNLKISEKILTIKDIEFKTSQYLINMIYNDHQYILIDRELWKALCEAGRENDENIEYKIYNNDIIFTLKDKKELKFTQSNKNKNIIDKSNASSYRNQSDFNELEKIYSDIINYYNFENRFIGYLNEQKKEKVGQAYLVTKEWFDNWKNYSDYDTIKENLNKNENDKHNILNLLIYHKEKKKKYFLNCNKNEKEIKYYSKKNDLKQYLQNNSLVLIDTKIFQDIHTQNYTKFSLSYQKITLHLDTNIVIDSKDNIISLNDNNKKKEDKKNENNKNNLINENNLNKFHNNENKEIFKNEDEENEKNGLVRNILSILINLFLFEKDLQEKINSSSQKNILTLKDCYLINLESLTKFRNIFSVKEINLFIENIAINKNTSIEKIVSEETKNIKNKKVIDLILNKMELGIFKILKVDDFLKIEKKIIQENIYIPENCYIINNDIYSKIIKTINKNEKISINNEYILDIIFVNKKMFLKPKKNDFFEDSEKTKSFIYIYSLMQNNLKEIKFIPEIILSFEKNERNNFIEIINNGKNFSNYNLDGDSFKFDKNKKTCNVINIRNSKDINKNKNETPSSSDEVIQEKKNMNLFLNYSIILYDEYNNLKTLQSSKNNTKIQSNELNKKIEYYLINREYMKKIEDILKFKEISEILNDLKIDKITNKEADKVQYYEKIIKLIEKKHIKLIDELKDKNEKQLSDIPLPELNKKLLKENIYFYENCQIINTKIYDFLNEINKNKFVKSNLSKCYISNNKIVCKLSEKNINIGIADKNIYIVENIICSEKETNIHNINEFIINNGYELLKNYFKTNNLIIVNTNIKAYYYNIKEDENRIIDFKISDKLKAIIFLVINEKIISNINNKNKIYEKVFLINNNWLKDYKEEFKEIYSLIKEDKDVSDYIEKLINNKSYFDSKNINNIYNHFDNQTLLKLEEKIKKKKIESKINPEIIQIINKKIKIYKEFIIVNSNIFDIIKNIFDDSINQQTIFYLRNKSEDIFTIQTNEQNTILIGDLNKEENLYNIKYILELDYINSFNNEKNIICGGNIDNYIQDKLNFANQKDFICPLFSDNNELIGYGYKYKQKIDYNSYYNYYELLSSEKISDLIDIYFNYKTIRQIINKKSIENKERYYIINKQLITDLKVNNEYKYLEEILKNNKIEEKNFKKIILALKNANDNILKPYKKNQKSIKTIKVSIEPDMNSIKYFDNPERFVIIYQNFEIFQKDIFEKIIDKNYISESNLLDCIFNNGKIIINLPENLNNDIISIIGKLNNDETFLTEYILIYKDKKAREKNFKEINRNIINYLKTFQFYDNKAPIIDDKYNELGIIFSCNNSNVKEEYNNNYEKKKIDLEKLNTKTTITKTTKAQMKRFNMNNDYEYNLDDDIKIPYIKNNFTKPPKIGLQNIGATCYMNATLQCFCHIEEFVNYFKYNSQIKQIVKKDKTKLTSSFKLLIENLWPSIKRPALQNSYAPEEFKAKISEMNPLFRGVAANDAKDLVNFIIMTLHEELNLVNNSNNNMNYNFVDQRNQQLMYNTFINNYFSSNKSIISQLFYGVNCNITQCNACYTKSFNFQTYFFIIFPLEEVRKWKINNYNQFMQGIFNTNEVTINDCFEYDRKVNLMSGDNAMYCNYCNRTFNSSTCTILTTGPRILILLLNRGKGIEFNVKINFTELLDLNNYIQMNNSRAQYKLIGVISHLGESGMGGHFIAYCRDPLTNYWHKYNDAIVSDVNNFQNEDFNFAMPYLLFYQIMQ